MVIVDGAGHGHVAGIVMKIVAGIEVVIAIGAETLTGDGHVIMTGVVAGKGTETADIEGYVYMASEGWKLVLQ